MSKTLIMKFRATNGTEQRISVLNPRSSLTKAEADVVGASIISKNIFVSTNGDLTQYTGAVIQERTETIIV